MVALPQQLDGSYTRHHFEFTGSGKEYFRIWLIDLLLSILSGGTYSAWAKVRKLQYFYRNTRLGGAPFDFHGDPKIILTGRLFTILFLIISYCALNVSRELGITIVGCIIAAAPVLLRNEFAFNLNNTSYRGLRFQFTGTIGAAYAAYLPAIGILLLPLALFYWDAPLHWIAASGLLLFFWPFSAAAIKRYRCAHISYGAHASHCSTTSFRFFSGYMGAYSIVLGTITIALIVAWMMASRGAAFLGLRLDIIILLLIALILCHVAIPYLRAKTTNLVWNNTRFAGLKFGSALEPRKYMLLQLNIASLSIFTLGLYRPFASVRRFRYQLYYASLNSGELLTRLITKVQPAPSQARDFNAESSEADEPSACAPAPVMPGYRLPCGERRRYGWQAVFVAMIVYLLGCGFGLLQGVPALADWLTTKIPISVELRIGDSMIKELRHSGRLKKSQLPASLSTAVQQIFVELQPATARIPMRVIVRNMPGMGTNALALPNGTIILSDQLMLAICSTWQLGDSMQTTGKFSFRFNGTQGAVQLSSEQKNMLSSILAHEMAHIERRHSMHQFVRAAVTAATYTSLVGDYNLSAGVIATLSRRNYVRQLEAEADLHAISLMREKGIPVKAHGNALDTLRRFGLFLGSPQSPSFWWTFVQSFFGTHPSDEDRKAALTNAGDG